MRTTEHAVQAFQGPYKRVQSCCSVQARLLRSRYAGDTVFEVGRPGTPSQNHSRNEDISYSSPPRLLLHPHGAIGTPLHIALWLFAVVRITYSVPHTVAARRLYDTAPATAAMRQGSYAAYTIENGWSLVLLVGGGRPEDGRRVAIAETAQAALPPRPHRTAAQSSRMQCAFKDNVASFSGLFTLSIGANAVSQSRVQAMTRMAKPVSIDTLPGRHA